MTTLKCYTMNKISFKLCSKLFLTTILALLLLTSLNNKVLAQSTYYDVRINALTNINPTKDKTYYFVFGDSVKNISDINTIRYTRLLEKALSEKGYTRINDTIEQKSNYVIALDFYIKSGKNFDITRSSSNSISPINTTNVNVNVNNNTNSYSSSIKPVEINNPFGNLNFQNSKEETIKETLTIYKRFLKVSCIEKNKEAFPLWILETDSEGYGDDLREIVPIMIFASKDYIESNTGTIKSTTIKSKNKALNKFLSGN